MVTINQPVSACAMGRGDTSRQHIAGLLVAAGSVSHHGDVDLVHAGSGDSRSVAIAVSGPDEQSFVRAIGGDIEVAGPIAGL